MYLYQRIRDLREDKDKTQQEIADYLEKGLTTYRRWETGEREIPVHIIIQLAKYYNVSLDYLVGLTNNSKPNWTVKNNVNIYGGKNKFNFE